MWFEIIPPFLIITAGVGLPGAALWWLHYFTLGNHYRRSLISRWDRRAYQRDLRLTGNPYQVNMPKQLEEIEQYDSITQNEPHAQHGHDRDK